MNHSEPSIFRSKSLLPAFLCGVVWWLIPVVFLIFPRDKGEKSVLGLFGFGVAAIVITTVVCVVQRSKPWSVMLWMPPASLASIACLSGAIRLIQEAGTLHGNLAPLAGVAMLFGLVAMAILFGATIFLLYFHPKPFHGLLTSCALLNSIAIGFAVSKFDYQSNKQDMAIHILDFQGRPISGAALRYERIGYGPGGSDVPTGRGGPVVSSAEGLVHADLRRIRNELRAVIQHPEYRTVQFSVSMQYGEWDTTRHFAIGTESKPVTWYGSIVVNEPLSMYVYMPPLDDRPNDAQIKRQKVSTDLGAVLGEKAFFDVEAGVFSAVADGDLRFELFYEPDGQYERARLRIHGLNGVGVQMLEPNTSFSEPISSPEKLFMIAPLEGYAEQVTIMEPGSSPGPRIFVSGRDGKLFAMLSVQLYGNRKSKTGECLVEIVRNIGGKRVFESSSKY